MHEIFISYSTKHRDLTETLVTALEQQYGVGSVWWDHALESREQYGEGIGAALDAARVVIVVWTEGATDSDWVYAEATKARNQNKAVYLRPAELAPDDLPLPFNAYHADLLHELSGALETVGKVWRGLPIPTRVPLHELYERRHGRPLLNPKQDPLPRAGAQLLPTDLLQARYAVVEFQDSGGHKRELVQWCQTVQRRAAGRVVFGPGGVGKTRLMAEVAEALREAHGWVAGFLDDPFDTAGNDDLWQALEQLVRAEDQPGGLLLVVDYAENRQQDLVRLAGLLAAQANLPARRPMRLLLLTRTAGQWWDDLFDEHPDIARLFRQSDGPDAPLEVGSIAVEADRLTLFRDALTRFGQHADSLGVVAPTADPKPEWMARLKEEPGFGRPLAIQMLALLWMASDAQSLDGSVAELLDRILGLERRRWEQLVGPLDKEAKRDLARAVAQVTLVPTESRPMLLKLLLADAFYGDGRSPARADSVAHHVATLYPARDGGAGALEPDLLGEHHVGRMADDRLVNACVQTLEDGGLTEQQKEERAAGLITVLQRATAAEHGARVGAQARALLETFVLRWTHRLANPILSVARAAPDTMMPVLEATVEQFDPPALDAIIAEVPGRSVLLDEFVLRVAGRRTDIARTSLASQASSVAEDERVKHVQRLANCVGTFGNRLDYSGQREDALSASEEAVEVCRELAARRPEVYLPDLAGNLNNLGCRFSDLGHREEARSSTEEAVGVYRELAAHRPDAFLPGLASSLNNMGACLSNLGRREEALSASEEAVGVYRELAARRPDAFRPNLAMSLSNLGVRLSNLGRREDALSASEEAVGVYRELAARRPDAFLPNLAMSLNNLGNRLSDLGRREDALSACEEAVGVCRELATHRPDAFLPDLAMSLNNLGNRLSDLGHREKAVLASEEAVGSYRELAARRPDAFLPDLAMSLNNISGDLSNLGRHEDALSASEESVAIRRELAARRPDAFLPDLASSLNNMGACLSNLGRREDALSASEEAVGVYRELAARRPDAFRPNLAMSLSNLGVRLSNLGRREDALSASEESVAIRRELAARRPDAFLPDLASSLNNMGACLSNLGRREDALSASEEAVGVYRELAARRPDAFRPNLAMSLSNLGVRLSNLGRREDALSASEEAAGVYRELAARRPDAFLPNLAMSLNNLGVRLLNLGRHEDALSASEESVAIRRELAARRPDAFLPDLATSVSVLSDACAALKKFTDAANAAHEALTLLAPFVEQFPERYSGLAKTISVDLIRYSESAGIEPDNALLKRVARYLGSNDGE